MYRGTASTAMPPCSGRKRIKIGHGGQLVCAGHTGPDNISDPRKSGRSSLGEETTDSHSLASSGRLWVIIDTSEKQV